MVETEQNLNKLLQSLTKFKNNLSSRKEEIDVYHDDLADVFLFKDGHSLTSIITVNYADTDKKIVLGVVKVDAN